MNIDSAIHSRLGPAVAGTLARALPVRLLRKLARFIGRGYARRSRGRVCDSIRYNQAIVRGLPPDHPSVDEAVVDVLVNTALGIVDLYGAVARGRQAVIAACNVDEQTRRRGEECLQAGRGLILVGPHMVGFELLILRLGLMGYDIQALSDPRPSGSHRSENTLRHQYGLLTTPISRSSVADAEARLQSNGVVLTGIDIPTTHGERLPFFGSKAPMPTLHAELAIRNGSPVFFVVPHRVGDNQYRGAAGEVFVTEGGDATPERVKELTLAVLSAAEKQIKSRPGHWKMLRPVWNRGMDS